MSGEHLSDDSRPHELSTLLDELSVRVVMKEYLCQSGDSEWVNEAKHDCRHQGEPHGNEEIFFHESLSDESEIRRNTPMSLIPMKGVMTPPRHQPMALITVGFLLTVPIYILVATLFAIYTPEILPTEVRLRASGICNTFGRAATILTPFLAVALFRSYGIRGVRSLMIGFLLVQIVVVLCFGIEPKKRRLEEMV
jgi:hypothetical protein